MLTVLAATATIASAQPIAFDPNYETSLTDGIPIKRMYFRSGNTKIYFRPPSTWEIGGWGEALTFRDKRIRDASIKFENGLVGIPKAFDEAGLEEYRKLARSRVAAEATDVSVMRETRDAVEINDWKGFEVAFGYSFFGQKLMRSILFVKLDPDREIWVTVDSPPADFEEMHAAAVRSLATWFEK